MMPCTHENAFLMGTAAGIRCLRCGQVFATFADIHPEADPEPAKEPEATQAPAPEAAQEKPKRTRKKKGE